MLIELTPSPEKQPGEKVIHAVKFMRCERALFWYHSAVFNEAVLDRLIWENHYRKLPRALPPLDVNAAVSGYREYGRRQLSPPDLAD